MGRSDHVYGDICSCIWFHHTNETAKRTTWQAARTLYDAHVCIRMLCMVPLGLSEERGSAEHTWELTFFRTTIDRLVSDSHVRPSFNEEFSMFLVRHTMQNLVRHTMTTVETMIIQISLSRSLPQNQSKINQQDPNIYPYFHDGIGIYVLPRSW